MEKKKMKKKINAQRTDVLLQVGHPVFIAVPVLYTVVRISSTLDVKLSNYVNNNDTLAREN